MPGGRAALAWGLVLSLALHVAWIGSAPRARLQLRRAPPAQRVELAVVAGAPRLASSSVEISPVTQAPPAAASAAAPAQPAGTAPVQSAELPVTPATRATPTRARAPRPRPRPQAPEITPGGPQLPAAAAGARDLGALERTLKRIAATSELTPDERRKAMLVVLRTWEDPSRDESAAQLIDALLRQAQPGADR